MRGDAPHQHHISYRHGEVPVHLRSLRYIADADVAARDRAVHVHTADHRGQNPGDSLQQSALARAVGTNDRDPFPTSQRERGVLQRGFAVAVVDSDPAELHHRSIRPMDFRFTHKRSQRHQVPHTCQASRSNPVGLCKCLARRCSLLQGFYDFLYIIAHHVDIGRCVAARLSHRMGIEIGHDLDPDLLG